MAADIEAMVSDLQATMQILHDITSELDRLDVADQVHRRAVFVTV